MPGDVFSASFNTGADIAEVPRPALACVAKVGFCQLAGLPVPSVPDKLS
jgi:hypothetical protein